MRRANTSGTVFMSQINLGHLAGNVKVYCQKIFTFGIDAARIQTYC